MLALGDSASASQGSSYAKFDHKRKPWKVDGSASASWGSSDAEFNHKRKPWKGDGSASASWGSSDAKFEHERKPRGFLFTLCSSRNPAFTSFNHLALYILAKSAC
jgi:hypothetical protein